MDTKVKIDTTRHPDQMVEGLLSILHELIPSVSIKCQIRKSADDLKKEGFTKTGVAGSAGMNYGDGAVTIWFDMSSGGVCVLRLRRGQIALTRHEKVIPGRLPDALRGLLVSSGPGVHELSQKIAARLSIATVLIARYLREGAAINYWTHTLILSALQQLTFRRYEGHRCTTGFIYTSKPSLYRGRLPIDDYEFVPFEQPIRMAAADIGSPASYRYVDGRNSFYLIDNWQKIHGLFVANDPKKYGLVDRTSLLHVRPLVRQMPGRVWAAFVGNNDDVNVLATGGIHLRWEGNYWHLRDTSILTSALEEQDVSARLPSRFRLFVMLYRTSGGEQSFSFRTMRINHRSRLAQSITPISVWR